MPPPRFLAYYVCSVNEIVPLGVYVTLALVRYWELPPLLYLESYKHFVV